MYRLTAELSFWRKKKKSLRNNCLYCSDLMGQSPSPKPWDEVPASLYLRLFYTGQVITSHSSHPGPALLKTTGINYRSTFSALHSTDTQMSFCHRLWPHWRQLPWGRNSSCEKLTGCPGQAQSVHTEAFGYFDIQTKLPQKFYKKTPLYGRTEESIKIVVIIQLQTEIVKETSSVVAF